MGYLCPMAPRSRKRTKPSEVRQRSPKTPGEDQRLARGAESRERIIEAATELFAERGYAGTGVDEIARRSGVVKSALYWHFGSKEGLLEVVMERVEDVWMDDIRRSVFEVEHPLDRIDRFVDGLRTIAKKEERLARLILVAFLERDRLTAPSLRILRRIGIPEQEIARGFEASLGVPLPDLDMLAHMVLAVFERVGIRRALRKPRDIDRAFDHLRRVILLDVQDQLARAGLPPLERQPQERGVQGGTRRRART